MRKRLLSFILVLTGIILLAGFMAAVRIFLTAGVEPSGERAVIYIPTGAAYEQVIDSLGKHLTIKNQKILSWVAEKKRYPSLIKPGRYIIEKGMSYAALINMLRSGSQKPVKFTFNNIRSIRQLAGKVGRLIEADSSEIASFLADPQNYRKDGFTPENIISVFIPDTYEFFWNTDPEGFYTRMFREYKRFWNSDRLAKSKAKKLTPVEVAILASIIDDEVAKADEKPRIAGVYLNRLKRGMPLQACPTIKFALNDFTITRVLNKHLKVDSPYNTYRHKGFPPGPVGCPTIEGLDAVLNAEEHDYLYFAARADFSGYHNFSRTLSEHTRYADDYQRELDRRKIFR